MLEAIRFVSTVVVGVGAAVFMLVVLTNLLCGFARWMGHHSQIRQRQAELEQAIEGAMEQQDLKQWFEL